MTIRPISGTPRQPTRFLSALVVGLCTIVAAPAATLTESETGDFIAAMVERHGFAAQELRSTLSAAQISQRVIDAISRPAEAKPWYRYRPIFVTDERASAGVRFWRNHDAVLARAERQFGVPAEIIVAIIGVETFYGRNSGGFRVLDALATLAFKYPPRSTFFRSELEQFLLLAREQKLNPVSLSGSYAGAMGLPQFIASSYRAYAVDFDADGTINIWDDVDDAIGSVGNYLSVHGWQRGQPVALPAGVDGDPAGTLRDEGFEPKRPLHEFRAAGLRFADAAGMDAPGILVPLEQSDGYEYWLGLRNLYVITRYNRSFLYAMAVLQLAQRIRAEHDG